MSTISQAINPGLPLSLRAVFVNVTPTSIPDVLVIEPRVFRDDRGFFKETYERNRYSENGMRLEFVQDNVSQSSRGTLRGLHYQIEHPQGKLVQVLRGAVFDVAVDMRRRSPTFGKWVGATLSAENHRQIYIPPGFAHGFCVLDDVAEVFYKCTDFYFPDHERTLMWNDPEVGIEWPFDRQPVLSEKDARGMSFSDADVFE